MQDVLDKARELCADEALFGIYERDPVPGASIVPCQDVVVVCLENSVGVPKVHCYPFVNLGDHVLVGGQAGKIPTGKYKGCFFEKGREPSDTGGAKLMAAGVTKRLAMGTTSDSFRENSMADSTLFTWVYDMVEEHQNTPKVREFSVPECYICADDTNDLIPGRSVNHRVLRASQFGTVDGVPTAPEAGLIEKHTKAGVVLNGTLIEADSSVLEGRAEPVFGQTSIALYPLPKVGERVKQGQALFTPFPTDPQIQTSAEVDQMPNARVLRWLVMQDSLIGYDGMTLAPLSCISPESSTGEKFVDVECARLSRVSLSFNPRTDPLWMRDDVGVEMNFRYPWHRKFIIAADRAKR